MQDIILEVKDLKKYFKIGKKSILKAVDGVSFNIKRGETLSLVGESGCGKSTCGRTILQLYKKTDGKILFNGIDCDTLDKKSLIEFKKNNQIIFQDPYTSLDPRMTISEIISEGIDVHYNYSKEKKMKKVKDLLLKVGLTQDYFNRFIHELSGGQRQRIGIARVLAIKPKFIVCDEPISALDVSIQAQVINLLLNLQKEFNLTYLFISHDLSMVKHISDRVAVMYLGMIVEIADNNEIYENPLHPYTKALISSIPRIDYNKEGKGFSERIKLEGEVPSPINTPSDCCKFKSRCPISDDICSKVRPKIVEIKENHFVACHKVV